MSHEFCPLPNCHPHFHDIMAELRRLNEVVTQIKQEIHTMSTTAVTRDQFDAALKQLLQAEAARDAVVIQALNDLIAKVGSGQITPEDFVAELGSVQTLLTNAATITQTATADDPGPTTVPTTPATPPTS